jgi:hypothetical protein
MRRSENLNTALKFLSKERILPLFPDCVPAFQTSANPMTHGLRTASSSAVSAKRLGMLSRFARSVRKAF